MAKKLQTAAEILSDPSFVKAIGELDAEQLKAEQAKPAVKEEVPVAEPPAAKDGGGKEAAQKQEEVPEVLEDIVQEEDDQPEWIDDDLKELAKSYGFSEARLKRFSSKEDFENAAELIDEQLISKQAAKSEMVDPLGPPAETEKAKPEPKKAAPKASEQQVTEDAEQFDIEALRKEGFDEHSLKLFAQVNKERTARAALEKQLADVVPFMDQMREQQEVYARQQQEQVHREFHSILDELDPKRFGRAMDDNGNLMQITADQKAERDRAWMGADQMARNITSGGRGLPPLKMLVKRAYSAEFAQEILADKSASLRSDLKAQSSRRRPVGTSRPVVSAPPKAGSSLNERVSYITSDPEFNRAFKLLETESGAR